MASRALVVHRRTQCSHGLPSADGERQFFALEGETEVGDG